MAEEYNKNVPTDRQREKGQLENKYKQAAATAVRRHHRDPPGPDLGDHRVEECRGHRVAPGDVVEVDHQDAASLFQCFGCAGEAHPRSHPAKAGIRMDLVENSVVLMANAAEPRAQTNAHFLADTTKPENVSRKVAKIAKGELKNLAVLSFASLRLCEKSSFSYKRSFPYGHNEI